MPTQLTDTIPKTEINIKHLKSIKKESNRFKNIKKEDYYNQAYMNRTYRKHVVVKKLNSNFDKLSPEDAIKYFDEVYLDEMEVEEYVCKKDREVHRSFKHRCKECKIGFMATADLYRHQNFEHHKVTMACLNYSLTCISLDTTKVMV